MGYNSYFMSEIDDNTKLDSVLCKEMQDKYKDVNDNHIYGFYEFEFNCENDNKYSCILRDIIVGEQFAKFYDDEKFANDLSKVMVNGVVRLFFNGEDGGSWGYEVRPMNVIHLTPVFVDMDKYNYISDIFTNDRLFEYILHCKEKFLNENKEEK